MTIPAEAYIDSAVIKAIEENAATAAGKNLEWMGLLLGEVNEWEGREYVVIDGLAQGGNEATAVSVRFGESSFTALAEAINKCANSGKIVVGWVHTHPGYGCFLSSTDLKTQTDYFNSPFHVAMVVDPHKREGDGMLYRFFKLDSNGEGYRQASFAAFRKNQAPEER